MFLNDLPTISRVFLIAGAILAFLGVDSATLLWVLRNNATAGGERLRRVLRAVAATGLSVGIILLGLGLKLRE